VVEITLDGSVDCVLGGVLDVGFLSEDVEESVEVCDTNLPSEDVDDEVLLCFGDEDLGGDLLFEERAFIGEDDDEDDA